MAPYGRAEMAAPVSAMLSMALPVASIGRTARLCIGMDLDRPTGYPLPPWLVLPVALLPVPVLLLLMEPLETVPVESIDRPVVAVVLPSVVLPTTPLPALTAAPDVSGTVAPDPMPAWANAAVLDNTIAPASAIAEIFIIVSC